MPAITPPRFRNRSRTLRTGRLARVRQLSAEQGGVVSRAQIYDLGITRGEVRAHVRAGRWRRVWSRVIAVHTGELSRDGWHWAAVFEGGSRAMLDGNTALEAAGLTRFSSDVLRVSVPMEVKAVRAAGLDVRRTRRWSEDDLATSGVRRTRAPVAAVRAGLWAVSDKQAALAVTMTVQQGLATAEQIGQALLAVRRDRRRGLLHALVLDLLDGARSLGEVEFARECRGRGLPTPSRQTVRRGRGGRYYLDVFWDDFGVVVEIDGIHHGWAENVVADALRQNEVTLQQSLVLRLPLLGYRVAPEDFFAQIERALTAAGWSGRAACPPRTCGEVVVMAASSPHVPDFGGTGQRLRRRT